MVDHLDHKYLGNSESEAAISIQYYYGFVKKKILIESGAADLFRSLNSAAVFRR